MRTRQSKLLLALYGAIVLSVVPGYFASFPLPEFGAKLLSIAEATFVLLSFVALGDLLESILRIPTREATISQRLRQLWIGFGVTGTVVLLLAWAVPGSLPLKMGALGGGLAIVAGRFLWNHRWDHFSPRFPQQISVFEGILLGLGFVGVAIVFVACFSPITYYDSLVYHLALPSIYNRMGRVANVPSNLYSYFPGNCEMVYLFALNRLRHAEYVINLLGWGLSLSISVGIADWVRRESTRAAGALAFALWWTMPAVLLLSLGAYVDVPLAGFIFLAVRDVLGRDQTDQNPIQFGVAGLMAGYAFAVKYTGGLCVVLLGLYLLGAAIKGPAGGLRRLLAFAMGTALPALPWLTKNWLYIGNPVFPFFYQHLGSHAGWSVNSAAGYFSQLTEYGAKSHLFYELLAAPWKLSGGAIAFGGGFDVLGDFGWPLVLFSAPLAPFLRRDKQLREVALYALISFLVWYATKPVFRFLIATLPLMVFLAAMALGEFLTSPTKIVRATAGLLALPWLLSNFFIYWFIAAGLQPFAVSLGLASPTGYLERRLAFFPAFEFLNATAEGTTLVLGEQRTYHLTIPFVSSNLFALSEISQVCNNAGDFGAIRQYVRDNNVRQVLINEAEIRRLGGYQRFGFRPEGQKKLLGFLAADAAPVFQQNQVSVFKIRPT